MENKRYLLVAALCLFIFLVWTKFFSKPQPFVGQGLVVKESSPIPQSPIVSQAALAVPEVEVPESSLIRVDRKNLELVFIEPQACLKEVIFKDHLPYTFSLGQGFALAGNSLNFHKESQSADSVTFVAKAEDRRITQKYTFLKALYAIELDVKIENLGSSPLPADFSLVLGSLVLSSKNPDSRFQSIYVGNKEKPLHITPGKDQEFSGPEFIGLRDRYFCDILQPENLAVKAAIKKVAEQKYKVFMLAEAKNLLPGQQIGQKFRIYLGPQEVKLINQVNPQWSGMVNYGLFDLISQLLLQALELLHNLLRNWGLAVIALSILVYLILFPLTLKQMRSMKEMQILQPKIEELRKLYKDNPQKMNKEVMELYKEHKVNPLGGCLPLLLQMPVFFALYNALMRSVALRGANFLWIKDLSSPDRLMVFPQSIPLIGNELNILPIIMAVGMFFQQKATMVSSGSQAAEQQKIMLFMMPVLFGFIFYHMPAGLVLYWLTNSILMMIFQVRIKAAK